MAEIIDLDFYRKFRIILPLRFEKAEQKMLEKSDLYEARPHAKRFRRKRKLDLTPKVTKKD